jgi:NAD(P)-dependent dehydrogenase (short-subunit alcohol dehydrogenase family)
MTKIAVVTGAASGIGKAVVERFAKEDVLSIILDIDETGAKNVAAEIHQRGKQATFMGLDVTRESEVQAVFEIIKSTHGRVDILVNVAGGSMHRHPIDEFPLAHWRAVIDVNLTSTFLCCRAVMGLMKAQKGGPARVRRQKCSAWSIRLNPLEDSLGLCCRSLRLS